MNSLFLWVALTRLGGVAWASAMGSLQFPPTPVNTVFPTDCDPLDESVAVKGKPLSALCSAARDRDRSWRLQPPISGDPTASVRILLLGDVGVRDPSDPTQLGPGPSLVASHARQACGRGCDAVVFLGDNVYDNGINEPDDSAFLTSLIHAYSFIPDIRFLGGNHDWGPGGLVHGYKKPDRDRMLRLFRDIDRQSAAAGDAYFWQTDAGPLHIVALDTNYLVRRCRTRGGEHIECRGDPVPGSGDDQISIQQAVHQLEQTDLPWSLTLGHHPCRSNGVHGSVGGYRDFGLHLHSGDAFKTLFQQEIMDVDLYASGHDHSTQFLAQGPPSLVAGAGGKAHGPSTANSSMDFEAYCMLGFAILDASPTDLALEIHTLTPPGAPESQAACLSKMARRRPDLAVPQPACSRFLRGADRVWAADPAGCSAAVPPAD